MATNLIDVAQSYLTPEVILKASALVGESPAVTRRALDAATPSLVTGLAERASSVSGAQSLLGILEEAHLTGQRTPIAERLGGMSGADLVQLGKDLLGRVFGARLGPVVDALATSSGAKTQATSSLLGLAAPIVLGVLGQHVQAKQLDASGLAGVLAEQRLVAARALPTAVTDAIGGVGERVAPKLQTVRQAAPARGSSGRGLWPLLLLPLLILGGLFLRKREAPTDEWAGSRRLGAGLGPETTAAPPEAPPAPPMTPPPAPLSETTLRAPIPSAVAELSQFLDGAGGEPSKGFTLSDLNFELGTTNLTPGSLTTLEGVARVLAAHPGAQIRLEGHTDALGLPEANERLSLQRANAVKEALVARGVAADSITTLGFGQDQPLAPNDTAEGRARNRRIELIITR
jgi:outer membrane protein OmpA-like peptidoglycan-associated protein